LKNRLIDAPSDPASEQASVSPLSNPGTGDHSESQGSKRRRLTRGYDAGKKISGRKTFGIVDTLGLLMAVVVVAASVSDNMGGIAVLDRARQRSSRFKKLWCDAGFKSTFLAHARTHHVAAEVVTRIHDGRFEVLPRRWVVERTWSWLMNSRRLQVDYERDPVVHEGFVWAAQSRYLLRHLTDQAPA
jgi:transposase